LVAPARPVLVELIEQTASLCELPLKRSGLLCLGKLGAKHNAATHKLMDSQGTCGDFALS